MSIRSGKQADNWWGLTAPTTGPTGTTAIWLGLEFGIEVEGWFQGFRHYVASGDDGNYFGVLWDKTTLEVLKSFAFRPNPSQPANYWHNCWVKPQLLHSDTNRGYRLAILYPVGKRFQTTGALASNVTHHNITFVKGFTSTALSIVTATPTLSTFAPGIDILFLAK